MQFIDQPVLILMTLPALGGLRLAYLVVTAAQRPQRSAGYHPSVHRVFERRRGMAKRVIGDPTVLPMARPKRRRPGASWSRHAGRYGPYFGK